MQNNLALVQSVDVFTPVVDDPYSYGLIAAANSLSDLYAMGARPLIGLNIVGFPIAELGPDVLADILLGGTAKATEAGVSIIGGHTYDDREPKYGLAVTGIAHLDRLVTNQGAKPGDQLILTKPLGMGILTTAHKQGKVPEGELQTAIEIMATLNRTAAEAMLAVGVHACTDITGFGLLGHLYEMLVASNVGAEVSFSAVPILAEVWPYAEQQIHPGGTANNYGFLVLQMQTVSWDPTLDWTQQIVLCDAQTSGGLLMAVPPEKTDSLLAELRRRGVTAAAVIGTITDAPPGHIEVSA